MRVKYEIEMDLIPSNNTDLISIMDNMARAIEIARLNGAIIDFDDSETEIGYITLSYNEDDQPDPTD